MWMQGPLSNGITWLLHMAVQLYGLPPFSPQVTYQNISWGTASVNFEEPTFSLLEIMTNNNWSTGDGKKKKNGFKLNKHIKKRKKRKIKTKISRKVFSTSLVEIILKTTALQWTTRTRWHYSNQVWLQVCAVLSIKWTASKHALSHDQAWMTLPEHSCECNLNAVHRGTGVQRKQGKKKKKKIRWTQLSMF